ncbi:MAG TPA: hypothetical protein VG899_15565 [Mycobacteriales bacterium]|jgi:hypothetical protein|nr:hypothetical protein [Mycobacteriales bacterium]
MAARLHLIGLASAPPSVQFEIARPLEDVEVARLDLATSRLKILSAGSPYQAAVRAMSRLQAALEELRASDTESTEARTARVWTALRDLLTHLLQAIESPFGELTSHGLIDSQDSIAIFDELRAMPQLQQLRDITGAEPGRVGWYGDGAVRITADGVSPAAFDEVVPPLMNRLADGFAAILEEQAELINADSLYVRQLAAEVLYGRPTLVELDPDQLPQQQQWQLREIGLEDVDRAQLLLRRARARRAAGSSSAHSAEQPNMADPAEVIPQTTPEPDPISTGEQLTAEPEQDGSAAPNQAESEAAGQIGFPPADLQQLAAELARAATKVEAAYGEVPKFDEMFAAIAKDKQAFGGLLRQVHAALDQVQRAREAAGDDAVTISLPLDSEQLGMLDATRSEGLQRERQAAIAVLVVLRFLVAAMDDLAKPTEFSFRAGQMEAYKFSPTVGEHIRQLALTVARLMTLGPSRHEPNVSDSRPWLLDAVDRSIANGLPEGALLYGLAAISASGVDTAADLLAAGRSAIERFAVDGSAPAAELAIVLLGELLPTLQQVAITTARDRVNSRDVQQEGP